MTFSWDPPDKLDIYPDSTVLDQIERESNFAVKTLLIQTEESGFFTQPCCWLFELCYVQLLQTSYMMPYSDIILLVKCVTWNSEQAIFGGLVM